MSASHPLPLENSARVTLNKMAYKDEMPCARVLGGKANVIRCSDAGLKNFDIYGMLSTHLVLKYAIGEKGQPKKSGAEIAAYEEAIADFVLFHAHCTQELEATKRQQQDAKDGKKQTP